MSLQTAILCAKCKEILNSQDDIFGTSCGHLYHFLCLHKFHGKSTICSHCESYKPCMFKMFVEFSDQPISWEDKQKTIDLNNELEENKNKNILLEEKLKISQVSVQKLEGKLKKLHDTLISKDTIVSDLEEKLATLEEFNKFLTTENELNIRNFCSGSNNEMKNLNKKLEHLSEELKCETAKNSQLENENIQLKSFIETNRDPYQANLFAKMRNMFNKGAKENNEIEAVITNIDIEENKNFNCKNMVDNSNETDTKNIEEQAEQTLPEPNLNTVVVRNYRVRDLHKYSLKASIVYLAKKMNFSLLNEKIVTVISIKHNLNSASIIATFNNSDTKNKFLSNKKLLKRFPNTKHLEID